MIERIEPVPVPVPVPVPATVPVPDSLPLYDTSPPEPLPIFEPTRPPLDPPGTHSRSFHNSLATFVETLTSIQNLYLDNMQDRLADTQRSYIANFEKSREQNRELDEQVQARDWWSFLHTLAASLLAAASIVAGMTFLVAGGSPYDYAAGGTLIASGVSTIAGLTLNAIQSNPELATILMATGAAVGLIGSAGVALFSQVTTQELAGKLLVASIGVVSHLSEVAKESYASKISEIKSKNAWVQQAFEHQQDKMHLLASDADFFSQRMMDNFELCANIQRKHEQSIRKILLAQEYAG